MLQLDRNGSGSEEVEDGRKGRGCDQVREDRKTAT